MPKTMSKVNTCLKNSDKQINFSKSSSILLSFYEEISLKNEQGDHKFVSLPYD